MELKDFKVGQEVWVKPVWNAARSNPNPRKGRVKKVGRRYLTVTVEGHWNDVLFDAKNEFTQKTEYSIDFILYPSKQALDDALEKRKLTDEISAFFNGRKHVDLSLVQLREIKKILL